MFSPIKTIESFQLFCSQINEQAELVKRYHWLTNKSDENLFEIARVIDTQISKFLSISKNIKYDLTARKNLARDLTSLREEFQKEDKFSLVVTKINCCLEHFFYTDYSRYPATPFIADDKMMEVYVNLPCENPYSIDRSLHSLSGLYRVDSNFFGKALTCWIDKNYIPINKINVSEEMFDALWPHLKCFDSRHSGITADELNEILRKCKKLKELHLRDEEIKELSGELSNLEVLSLLSCSYVTKLPLKMPLLKILHLTDCQNLINIPEEMPKLFEFWRADCDQLEFDVKSLPEDCQRI